MLQPSVLRSLSGAACAELSSCGQHGLAVKPRLGDALLFWSMTLDGNTVRWRLRQAVLSFAQNAGRPQDSTSLHAGCPVIRGEKWTGVPRACCIVACQSADACALHPLDSHEVDARWENLGGLSARHGTHC
jgi:prolyl 4-hydroxylase